MLNFALETTKFLFVSLCVKREKGQHKTHKTKSRTLNSQYEKVKGCNSRSGYTELSRVFLLRSGQRGAAPQPPLWQQLPQGAGAPGTARCRVARHRERPLRRVGVSQRGAGHRRHLTKLQVACALHPGGTAHLSGSVTGEKRETREKRDDAGAGHGVPTSRRPEWVTSRCRTVTVHEPAPPPGSPGRLCSVTRPLRHHGNALSPLRRFPNEAQAPPAPAAPRAGPVSRNSAQRGGAAPPRPTLVSARGTAPPRPDVWRRPPRGGRALPPPRQAGMGWAGDLLPVSARPAGSLQGYGTVGQWRGTRGGGREGREGRRHGTASEPRRCLPAAILRPSAGSATCAGRRRALPGPGRAGRLSLTGCVFSPQGPRRHPSVARQARRVPEVVLGPPPQVRAARRPPRRGRREGAGRAARPAVTGGGRGDRARGRAGGGRGQCPGGGCCAGPGGSAALVGCADTACTLILNYRLSPVHCLKRCPSSFAS